MKKTCSVLISLVPIVVILFVIAYAPPISCADIEYHELVNSLGALMVGLGAFLAAYKFTFPLMAYLYFSDQIEDEDTWFDYINYKIELNGHQTGIQQAFRRYGVGARWWEPLCSLADALYFEMDKAKFKTKAIDVKFQKYKEDFQVLVTFPQKSNPTS